MGGKVAINGLCEAVGGLEITSGSDSVSGINTTVQMRY